MVRVKICGIRSIAEAEMAERCGADAIGIIDSPPFSCVQLVRDICSLISPFLTSVAVTHLEDPKDILKLAQLVPCPVLQFHANLHPDTLRSLRENLRPRRIVASVNVVNESAVKRVLELAGCVDAVVLDTVDLASGRVGGTGLVHDWSISTRVVAEASVRVMLAGGLRSDNVAEAIAKVRPWAVDVNSGVKNPDGRKSEELIRRFISAASAS